MPRKKTTDFNQQEYVRGYIHDRIRYKKINFNLGNAEDIAIMQWIDGREENTSAYLKRLVKEDMSRQVTSTIPGD